MERRCVSSVPRRASDGEAACGDGRATRRWRRPGRGSCVSPGRWSRAAARCWPPSRRPGAPLQAGVAGFLAAVEAARAELPAWALPGLADAQAASAAALDAAERRARELPAASEGLDFEHRNERVAEVLDELGPIQAAEQALRALRRRRG